MQPMTIDDGTLTLTIRRQNGEESPVNIDVWQAKLAAELVEEKHGASAKDWKVTPAFAADLAKAYAELGIEGCTPTIAYQIWAKVAALWIDLKKNMLGQQTSPTGMESTPMDSAQPSASG